MGDLFTVMEGWAEPARILAAMTTILDIEAEAARAVSAKPGLMQLLQLLKERQVGCQVSTHGAVCTEPRSCG